MSRLRNRRLGLSASICRRIGDVSDKDETGGFDRFDEGGREVLRCC
jgi:hypothetical protein